MLRKKLAEQDMLFGDKDVQNMSMFEIQEYLEKQSRGDISNNRSRRWLVDQDKIEYMRYVQYYKDQIKVKRVPTISYSATNPMHI